MVDDLAAATTFFVEVGLNVLVALAVLGLIIVVTKVVLTH